MSKDNYPVVIAKDPERQKIWDWLCDQATAQGVKPEDQHNGLFMIQDFTEKDEIKKLAVVGVATMAVTPNGVEVQLLFDHPGPNDSEWPDCPVPKPPWFVPDPRQEMKEPIENEEVEDRPIFMWFGQGSIKDIKGFRLSELFVHTVRNIRAEFHLKKIEPGREVVEDNYWEPVVWHLRNTNYQVRIEEFNWLSFVKFYGKLVCRFVFDIKIASEKSIVTRRLKMYFPMSYPGDNPIFRVDATVYGYEAPDYRISEHHISQDGILIPYFGYAKTNYGMGSYLAKIGDCPGILREVMSFLAWHYDIFGI